MSPAPTPQRDKTPSPQEPAAGSAAPPATGAARARSTGWAATAAAWLPPAIAAAAMLVIGWWGIARDSSMGNDEVATRWAALLPLHQLVHLLRNVDAVHGLYYLLMHGWKALGSTPVIMRIPSVIAMAVAAALIAVIGRRLTGSGWAGLFAGLIMVTTPSISFYAQTARSYAMVFACVLAATLVLLHALAAAGGGGDRRWWVVYAGLVALGGYLNEMSLLVLAAHAVTVWLTRYGRAVLERWLAAAAVGAALVVPLVLLSIKEHAALGWVGPPGLSDIRILVQDYFGVETVAAALLIVCAAVALLPPAGTWRPGATARADAAARAGAEPEPAWWRSGGVTLPSVALPLLVLPAAILLIESLLLQPLYVDRYVLYGEAGAALLAGGGIYRIGQWLHEASGQRALVWAPGVVLCLSVLVLQLAPLRHVHTPQSRRYDYGGPSRYVGAHARPGDGIIFFGKFYRKAKLGYPGDFRNTTDFPQALSPRQVGNFQGRDKPVAETLQLMPRYRRIWVLGARPSLSRPEPELRRESAELLRDFTLVASRRFHGIILTLWQRR